MGDVEVVDRSQSGIDRGIGGEREATPALIKARWSGDLLRQTFRFPGHPTSTATFEYGVDQ
jgi:hypothetical protein